MPIILDGTTGISGVDGSATTPAIKGSDTTGNGIFYGTDTVSIATSGSTAVTVDSSQNVGIGTTTPGYKLDIFDADYAAIRLIGNLNVQSQMLRYSDANGSAQRLFYRSRGTNTSPTTVADNDITGRLNFFGYDGASFYQTGEIRSVVDGAVSTGVVPGKLMFLTNLGGTNATEAAVIDSGQNVLLTGAGGLGYGSGSGGTVTQATSRTTGVTLNKSTGAITLFTTTAVVGTWFSFTVTNSKVVATDTVVVSVKSGTNTYVANVSAVSLGSFRISAQSISGTASDAPVINFAVIKAVTA